MLRSCIHHRLKLRDNSLPSSELPSTGLVFPGPPESSLSPSPAPLPLPAPPPAPPAPLLSPRHHVRPVAFRRHKTKPGKHGRCAEPSARSSTGNQSARRGGWRTGGRPDGRTMAEADEEAAALQFTPTWIVAAVCSILVLISLAAERGLHHLGKVRI